MSQPAPYAWDPATRPEIESRIKSFYRAPDGSLYTDLSNPEIVKTANSDAGHLWVDIDCHETDTWLALAETLGFHPLTIEDTLSPNSRIKVEEYDNYLFVVCRDAAFATDTPDLYDFSTSNIYLFLGKSWLFTVHARPSRPTQTLAERLSVGPELLDRGVDYMAYAVLDALVDLYFPLLDEIDHFIDEIENDIFREQGSKETLEKVFDLKRTLISLRRQHSPMREVISTIANRPTPYVRPSVQVYFRDVYDHIVRQVESIETYRDLLTGALDIHFSVVSTRMNEIMKALAIVGTFLLPATWVASVYGMNFEKMPFLHSESGFFIAMFAMLAISVVLLGYMRHKRWL